MIEKIEIFRINIPLTEAYNISIAQQVVADYVVIRIVDDEGIVGIGEAAPLPGDSSDTTPQIYSAIQDFLGKNLISKDPFDIENINYGMDKLIPLNLYAKAAIDIALHDYCAKRAKISLAKFIGGTYRQEVNLVGSIGIYPEVEKAVKKALQCINEGYKTLKIKIGHSKNYDEDVVRKIRDACGKDVNLRLDVNQNYSKDIALRRLQELERYEPELIEQPLPFWDLAGMQSLTRDLDTPIVADEAVSTPQDAINIISNESADMIKVKVMRCGGIRKTRQICDIASAAGIPIIIGSGHQSSIGVAAELHLAASNRIIVDTAEMVGHLRLLQDTVKNPIRISNGSAKIPSGSGIGVALDESLLSERQIVVRSAVIT